MRAKLPKGRGLWPAFWLLATDRSWPPEIDVMEVLGHEPSKLYTTLHTAETGTNTRSDIPAHNIPDSSAGFHTYAVEWGPADIVFYFDDKEIARRPTPADMHKPFFMLINLAVGGGWPGSPTASTVFPAVYEIDWVRAYKRSSYVSTAVSAKMAVAEPVATTSTVSIASTTTAGGDTKKKASTRIHNPDRRNSPLR
jgi:beta-glucanase (GH16 family)